MSVCAFRLSRWQLVCFGTDRELSYSGKSEWIDSYYYLRSISRLVVHAVPYRRGVDSYVCEQSPCECRDFTN